jgi:hypothetical protein
MASTVKEMAKRGGLSRRTVPLAAAAFALNAAWEVAHWPLYECPWSPRALTGAAAVDATIILGAAEIAWRAPDGRTARTVFLGALGGAALILELGTLQRGRRFYAPAMPTVGGVGITPLAQLPLTGAVAVGLTSGRRPPAAGR